MVYDNSPADYVQGPMPEGSVYVRDTDNHGLSCAYNCAARYAGQHGYSRVLLLDQDTVFPDNAVEAYASASPDISLWVPSVQTKNDAPLSPARPGFASMKAELLSPGMYSLYDYWPINSGMCVALSAFREAGGYDERVRLDFSDFQFLRRLRKVDDKFCVIPCRAIQDFSADVTDINKIMVRLAFYIEGASRCTFDTRTEKRRHGREVFRHVLSVALRTRRLSCLTLYFKKYLFASNK